MEALDSMLQEPEYLSVIDRVNERGKMFTLCVLLGRANKFVLRCAARPRSNRNKVDHSGSKPELSDNGT